MKSLRITTLATMLCAGIASIANATLTGPITVGQGPGEPLHDQSPATILAYFQANFDADASTCLRVEQGGLYGTFALTGGGSVTISPVSTGVANISFDLTGSGQVICGFEIFGGGSANFYTVSADEGVTGSFNITTPLNNGGRVPGISHIQIFCCPGQVPDSGTTAVLLGVALMGLGVVRHRLRR
jgi:hypothetical protein